MLLSENPAVISGEPVIGAYLGDQPVPVCLLNDSFDTLSPTLWTSPAWIANNQAAVEAGRLIIPQSVDYAEVMTASRFDFLDTSFEVEAVAMPTYADLQTYMGFWLRGTVGAFVQWQVIGNNLSAGHGADSSFTEVWVAPYDPIQHRWWRISERDGAFYWSTSPDRATWTERASWVWQGMTLPPEASTAWLGGGYWGTPPPAGTRSEFDNARIIRLP